MQNMIVDHRVDLELIWKYSDKTEKGIARMLKSKGITGPAITAFALYTRIQCLGFTKLDAAAYLNPIERARLSSELKEDK